MVEFFKFILGFAKDWRRRLGIRLLIVASFLTFFWIRSLGCYDEALFHTGYNQADALVSTDSSLGWERRSGSEIERRQSLSFMEIFPGNHFVDISASRDPRTSRWDWNWYWCGFASGTARYGRGDAPAVELRNVWIVPYWSIVAPLILIAVWLSLGKAPKPSAEKLVESIPEVVT